MPLCPQSQDGSITPNVLGGTLPYTYNWEDQTTEAQRKKLLAGIYTLKVTDKKGCEVKKEYTLKTPLSLELVNVKKNDPLCYGDRNGSISVDGIGCIAPYTFRLTQGAKVNHIENVTAGAIKFW